MGQEWDYPPNRNWQPEIRVLPGQSQPGRRFERLVEHDRPKAKTAWRWYQKQMQGNGSWLYKANITALYFTIAAAFLAAIAVVSIVAALLISQAAHAQEATPIEHDSQVMSDFPQELLPIAVTLIEQKGWHCDSISAARKWVWSPGFTVVCNTYRYEYDIEDRGGNLEVSLK